MLNLAQHNRITVDVPGITRVLLISYLVTFGVTTVSENAMNSYSRHYTGGLNDEEWTRHFFASAGHKRTKASD